ncbi:MAG: FAD-dependent oxidoreductase, partial [Polyangiaceae bacterium]
MNALTRRELLAGFLSLPVALSACKRKPKLPPGDLVFRSELLGHRVRDHKIESVAASAWRPAKIVIVGGGVAGLSAAWRLRRAGFDDFTMLELDPAAGGTSKSGSNAISAYPWGAHYITQPMRENRALISLLAELDVFDGTDPDGERVVREEILCRDPQERLFYAGKWHEGLFPHEGASAQDEADLTAFEAEIDRFASLRDAKGRRAFAIPVETSSDDAMLTELDGIDFATWLDRKSLRSPRLRWFLDYACRDDYGARLEDTSAWAGVFYFAGRMKQAGAAAQPVLTWPEGNGRLVAHLSSSAKGRIQLATAATEIDPQADGIHVSALTADGATFGLVASRVIFAAPQFLAKAVIRPYRDAPPSYLAAFDTSAWMVANLTLTERPKDRGAKLAWDSVLYDSPSLGYVSATHQRCIDHGPNVVTYYYPLCDRDTKVARQRLLSTDRDAWADIALSDLETAHPHIRDQVAR